MVIPRKKKTAGRVPNPERTERSRRAIIAAATPVFAERGYAAASLNEIIRASGLTKGGFYFHFPSKLALALAVVAEYQTRWGEQVIAEVARHPRAVDRLFAVPRVLGALELRGEGPTGLHKLTEELMRDQDVSEQVYGSLRIWIQQTAAQFREAQVEGTIRSDLDPNFLAEIAVGGFIGMQALTAHLGDRDLERRVEALIDLVKLAALPPPMDGREQNG